MPDFQVNLGGANYTCDLLQETDDCGVILKMTNANGFHAIMNANPGHVNLV